MADTSPMRVAFVTERAYRHDRLFAPRYRSDPFEELRRRLTTLGHEVHTADIFEARGDTPDLLVHVDALARLRPRVAKRWRGLPRWLLLIEPEVTLPQNGSSRRAAQFDRVFTWRRNEVDNAQTFGLHFPYPIETATAVRGVWPDRFCTLVAANKRFRHPLELYSQRRAAIRWFEQNHPEAFDLFGYEWDLLVLGGPRIVRALNVLMPDRIRRILGPSHPSYRGAITDKIDVLSRYRFSICFENSQGLDGYVSEKLFDCFVAGSVPVYWGAPDIAELVPGGFIDYREFATFEALYEHLRSLDGEEYAALRAAGKAFVESDRARETFGFERWVDTLVSHIDGQLRGAGPPKA